MKALFIILYGLVFANKLFALDSLSYSGRLVNTNGSPVSGPVNLKIELAYSNAPATILCSEDFSNINLSNGVFHLKLDLDCGASSLNDVLAQIPVGESSAIRVTDVTNNKAYSFQALHSMPFAKIAETAKQLSQMGATNNQVLQWNNTAKKWEPGAPVNSGTVTSVTTGAPLSVTNGSTTPNITLTKADTTTDGYLSAADWNVFNGKQGTIATGSPTQYYRGDKSWQTLDSSIVPENVNLYFTNARALGVPLTGFNTATGSIIATDSIFSALEKAQGQIDAISTESGNFLVKNNVDEITGLVKVETIGLLELNYEPVGLNDAANKAYVDTKLDLIGGALTGDLTLNTQLKFKDGTSSDYVILKAPASGTTTHTLTLPGTVGTSGQILSMTGTAGVLAWTTPPSTFAPSGTAGGDLSGTYPNPTITGLAATKISSGAVDNAEYNYLDGVTSAIQAQLNGKQTTNATLTAFAAYNTNGILVQTAANTFAGRSISGTTNRVTIANGDGISGNPAINIDTALLPSPVVTDAGKFLKASGADASTWSLLSSSDITTALGFTPVDKAGDTVSSGIFNFNGSAVIRTLDPVGPTDVVTKQYVDNNGQWSKNGSGDVYRSSGNVGIGTSTPASMLHISGDAGSATIQRANSSGPDYAASLAFLSSRGTTGATTASLLNDFTGKISFGGSDGSAYTNGSRIIGKVDTVPSAGNVPGALVFETGDNTAALTERMRISSSGNLGIGTTTPNVLLQIAGAAESLRIQNDLGFMSFYNSANTTRTGHIQGNSGSGFSISSDVVGLPMIFNTAASERMRIDGVGNVGIGTTTPNQKLAVRGAPIAGQSIVAAINNPYNYGVGQGTAAATFLFQRDPTSGVAGYMAGISGGNESETTSTSGYLALSTRSGVPEVLTERMRINSAGNVGIGTGSPESKLEVVLPSGGGEMLRLVGGTYTNRIFGTGFRFSAPASTSNYNRQFSFKADSSSLRIHGIDSTGTYAADTAITLQELGGKVGIGTLTPQTKLDVNGAVRVGSDATVCSATIAGAMRFNTPNVEFCNGSAWQAFGIGDATLSALSGFNTNGILVQTATDTFVGRTITGTANRLTVDNGDGVGGNPTINIATALLPSPVVADIGKFLRATAADASAWVTLALADITTALGFTPINKAGDTISTGVFTFNGAAVLRTLDPIGPTDVATRQFVESYGQWTKSGSDLYRPEGKVGIGTVNPLVPLDVVSTSASTNTVTVGEYLQRKTTGTAANGLGVAKTYVLQDEAGTLIATNSIASTWVDATAANRYARLDFYSAKNNTQSLAMSIDQNGKVGVGTVWPASKMHIEGAETAVYTSSSSSLVTPATASSMTIQNSSPVDGSAAYLQIISRNTSGGNNYSYIGSVATASAVTPSIVFGQRTGATAYSERMRIDSNGRVGIGIDSPQASLHITNGGASGSLSLSGGSSHSLIKMGNKDSLGSSGPNVIRAANRAIAFGVGTDHTDPNAGTFTEYFRINPDGNVGIGTTNPLSLLTVRDESSSSEIGIGGAGSLFNNLSNNQDGSFLFGANLAFQDTVANKNVVVTPKTHAEMAGAGILVGGNVANINGVRTNDIGFFTAPSGAVTAGAIYAPISSMIVKANGNVGIGSSLPTSKLEIQKSFGANGNPNTLLKLNAEGTASTGFGAALDFLSSNESSQDNFVAARISSAWESADNGFGIGFWTKNLGISGGATTEKMRITYAGRVGIGVVAPTAKLQIASDGANDLSLLNSTAVTGKNWVLASENNGAFSLINRTANIRRFSLDSNNDFNFITSASTVSMLITDSGYVGIGTITPTTKLDVRGHTSVGTTAAGAYIAQSAPDGYRDSIRLNRASGNFTIGMSTTGTDLQFGAGGTLSDANTKLTITSTGTVGVGVLVPSYTLHVNGSVAGNSAYTNTSDLRLKRNIASIPGALEKITSLEGIYYNWRADQFPSFKFGHRREMGVIAQQIEKIFPEAVFKDNKGFRSVAYSMLIAPIIEAIKEMKELLLGHDEEIAALKKENAIMKSYLCAKDKKASFCKY